MQEELDISISDIRKLTDAVAKAYGYNLSNMALTSLKHRISRYLQTNSIDNIDILINKLQKDKTNYQRFIKDIEVDVTELFRDPSLWRYLRDITLPNLAKNFNNINIWIPNCSSGDEVFSIAILLKEMGYYDRCKIFATALNEEILQKAKRGIYPISKLELSDSNYKRYCEGSFDKYYTLDKSTFLIEQSLLSNVNFDVFDFNQEKFHKAVHIILCRNYMIYLNSHYQEQLVNIYHKSLISNGCLIIGHKENIAWCRDYKKFSVQNENEKVYKKTEP